MSRFKKSDGENNHTTKLIASVLALIALTIILIIAASNLSAFISSFFIKPGIYQQDVLIIANSSEEFPITLEKHPENFELISFKISGKLIGNGDVKVYLENNEGVRLLVLDSDKFRSVTGMAVDETNYSEEMNDSGQQEELELPAINETIPEENISMPEIPEKNNLSEESNAFSFESIGIETGEIKVSGFNEGLKLIIEISGKAEISIEKIDYSVVDLSLLAIKAAADPEIYQELSEKGSAMVIIELKSDRGMGIMAVQESKEEVLSSLDVNEIEEGGEFELIHYYEKINALSGEIDADGLAKLLADPNVKSVKIDRIIQIQLSDSSPLINATEVWKKQIDDVNITGKGLTACVLDTGINKNHPALESKVINEYCYCSLSGGCCNNGNITDTSALDDNSHGTHVAGIIASSDSVYRGVAPDAKLVAVKVCNSAGSCSGSDIIAGIEYCTENALAYNISVISISIGGGEYSEYCDSLEPAMTAAINNAAARGIPVVVSSGNSGSSSGISWPACVRNATAVTATTKTDEIWSSSNRNSLVDLAAPGSSITSTMLSGFGSKSGTSMAAPHVSGAILLLTQYYNLYNGINPPAEEIEKILKKTGKSIHDSSGLNYQRINALEAADSIYKTNQAESSIEKIGYAKIMFNETIDLSQSLLAFTIRDNFIELNDEYSQFNRPATIYFYNLGFEKTPVILRDGIICEDCAVNSYADGNLSFAVPHFTSYSAGANSLLDIWNNGGIINENTTFYANYTNRTSGMMIENADCKISFSDIEDTMHFDGEVFSYDKIFSTQGDYTYRISCTQSEFENLSSSKIAEVSKRSPVISLMLDGKSSDLEIINDTGVNISASLTGPENGMLILLLDNSTIGNGTSPISTLIKFESYGTFSVTSYFEENENYKGAAETLLINVRNDIASPKWSNKNDSGSLDYEANQNYHFNITWTDNIALSNAWIEHNFNGSFQNYSANKSGNVYYYALKNLKAGSYSYRWHANDSSNNKNSTDLFNYSINRKQSQIKLELNSKEGDVLSIRKDVLIEATLLIPSTGDITIKKGSSIIKTGSSSIEMKYAFSTGLYTISAKYNGNENYTNAAASAELNVDLEDSGSSAGGGAGSEYEEELTETAPEVEITQCTENWQCSAWSSCVSGQQTRTCYGLNRCGTLTGKPAESQNCGSCTPSWKCSDWGICINGTQKRTCTDSSNCGTNTGIPSLTQPCALLSAAPEAATNIIGSIFDGARNTFDFSAKIIKEKPVYIILIIAVSLIIFMSIKFGPSGLKFIKGIRIVVKVTNKNEMRDMQQGY